MNVDEKKALIKTTLEVLGLLEGSKEAQRKATLLDKMQVAEETPEYIRDSSGIILCSFNDWFFSRRSAWKRKNPDWDYDIEVVRYIDVHWLASVYDKIKELENDEVSVVVFED